MSTQDRTDAPTAAEIAALTARLRALSTADSAERARFLADKDALIARITAASRRADPPPRDRADAWIASAAQDALAEIVRAKAADGGYALVGPSARTWRADPATGRPVEPVDEAEHKALRQLMAREEFTTTEPAWTDDEIGSTVIPVADEPDTDEQGYWTYNQGWIEAFGDEDADSPTGERGLTGAEGPPIDAGPAMTAEQAARELAVDGRSLDEARALVRGYLDEVSERVGAPVHQWGLDEADLADMRAGRTAARSADEPDEQARRDQLNRWQADDRATEAVADDIPSREMPS